MRSACYSQAFYPCEAVTEKRSDSKHILEW